MRIVCFIHTFPFITQLIDRRRENYKKKRKENEWKYKGKYIFLLFSIITMFFLCNIPNNNIFHIFP